MELEETIDTIDSEQYEDIIRYLDEDEIKCATDKQKNEFILINI